MCTPRSHDGQSGSLQGGLRSCWAGGEGGNPPPHAGCHLRRSGTLLRNAFLRAQGTGSLMWLCRASWRTSTWERVSLRTKGQKVDVPVPRIMKHIHEVIKDPSPSPLPLPRSASGKARWRRSWICPCFRPKSQSWQLSKFLHATKHF